MPLGTEVDPGQTNIVLDGIPLPTGRGANWWGGLTLMLEYLKYDVGLNGGPIGKHPWAVDWRRQIYPPMTMKDQSVHRNI